MTREPTDEELIHRSEMIFQVMDFVFRNRALVEWFPRELFCGSIDARIAPCDEILALARDERWIEEEGDQLRITPYGRDWESKYWGTFR